jgi:carbon starvation protein CstA
VDLTSPALVSVLSFVVYYLGYRFHALRIARRVFQLDASAPTPAHTLRDEIDYLPCRRSVLFGHHFASIAGLSPMLGPAIAVIWGWLPALLWVVLGALFIGAVHDFSALVVSMRARGTSIGKVAESILGSRAKSLFHVIIFFLVALAMGVFVQVVAQLFSAGYHPEAVFPSAALIVLAVAIGVLFYKKGLPLSWLTLAGFVLTLVSIYLGLVLPRPDLSPGSWSLTLLLYLGLVAIFVGFFFLRPEFAAPAVNLEPEGAPPLFPFVFIVIACGATSGFHGLVSSGTTAKQIDKETDAPLIGYGGMIGESSGAIRPSPRGEGERPHPSAGSLPNRSRARAFARAASTSRSRRGDVVTRLSMRPRATSATSSTARSNASSFAFDGFVNPLSLRTNWTDAARISSSVAGGSKLKRVLMFRHTLSILLLTEYTPSGSAVRTE